MKLISKNTETQTVYTGQNSDGSDRTATTVTTVVVTVLDDDGIQRTLTFDHDPAASEVYSAFTAATPLTPTSKADWARAMASDYAIWQRWHNTRLEAVARSLNPAVITAVTNQENAAWSQYLADMVAWNNAS